MWSDRQLTLTDYWLLFRRHRWWFIAPFIVVCTSVFLYSLTRPNIYRARTSVLVEAPKVPDSYVQSTVSMRVQERLRTVTQQIKSRTRLEQMGRELQLIGDALEGRALDDYVTNMSDHIEVTVEGSGNDIFIVSYEGRDPRTVMLVANKLVSLFIQDNLKMREQYAEGTTEFLEDELQRVRGLLQTQEKIVSEYKQRNMGELPTQQDTNQRTLDRLQMQSQFIVATLESVRTRKGLLLRQIAQQGAEAAPSPTSASRPSSSEPAGLEQQLEQRRLVLAQLQRVYMDTYPDIVLLKQQITALEAQMAAQKAGVQAVESIVPQGSITARSIRTQQQNEVEQIEQEEEKLRQQQANVQAQIAAYEKRLANTFQRAQEMSVLTRDYETTQKNYDSLLARRQQAQVAENLEKRQKSEQFRVLDEARIPTKPWKPKRFQILLQGIGLGLAVGGGAICLVAYLDQTFYDLEALEQFTALPVLATIPVLITPLEQRKQRRKRRCFWAASLVMPAVTIAAVHFLWMRLDVLFTRTVTLMNF
jgi:polysaccharide chain length determinant protein (PEP-CTERM system associated)